MIEASYLRVVDRDHPSRTLIIDGTKAKHTEYSINIVEGSGWLRKNTRQDFIQSGDFISDDRTRAKGIVGVSQDAYTFTATLKEISLIGDKENVVVKVDSEQVNTIA